MKELNIKELLKVGKEYRNEYIFNLYRGGDSNILLCCGDVDGVLIEEDLETVLDNSSIDLVISNSKVSILAQKNNLYVVDLNTEEDEKEISYYLDFSTLREITSLKDTYIGVLSVGGIISSIHMDTEQDKVEETMYSKYPEKDFDSSEDDARIFNGLEWEIKSCYTEELDEEETDSTGLLKRIS